MASHLGFMLMLSEIATSARHLIFLSPSPGSRPVADIWWNNAAIQVQYVSRDADHLSPNRLHPSRSRLSGTSYQKWNDHAAPKNVVRSFMEGRPSLAKKTRRPCIIQHARISQHNWL